MNKIVKKSKKEVKDFLDNIRQIDKDSFHFIRRNNEPHKDPYLFMSKLEYDVDDVIEIIYNLTCDDYLRCEIDGKNKFLFMYHFIKTIKEYIAYIKLSIVEKNNQIAYVISFHEALKNELNERPFRR